MRVRHLGVKGRLNVGLNGTDTTLDSPGLVDLPAIVAPDFAVIVVDPDAADGRPEVVYVTAHVALAESATIVRGRETSTGGSAARAHVTGMLWYHATTVPDSPVQGDDWHYVGDASEPAFENGWSTITAFVIARTAFRLNGPYLEMVVNVNFGSSGARIFQLPVGYRPNTRSGGLVIATNTFTPIVTGTVSVESDGSVSQTVPQPGTTFILAPSMLLFLDSSLPP